MYFLVITPSIHVTSLYFYSNKVIMAVGITYEHLIFRQCTVNLFLFEVAMMLQLLL